MRTIRIWHKDLIPILPRKQLLGQWRECCLIAKNIAERGTPNHLLVNQITQFSEEHFVGYCQLVFWEIKSRGYNPDWKTISKYFCPTTKPKYREAIFIYWHDDRYLRQCLMNLEEKAICGGIPKDEWQKIVDEYGERFDLWEWEDREDDIWTTI